MTHEDMTTKLRDPRQTMSIDAQTTMLDAADRLDRYRELLLRARIVVPASFLKHIEEALK
jgi:hypothetical protein